MKHKLDPDLVTEIVEDDPVASAAIQRLFDQWRDGRITTQRLGRLRSNAIGNALSRWRSNQNHQPRIGHSICA